MVSLYGCDSRNFFFGSLHHQFDWKLLSMGEILYLYDLVLLANVWIMDPQRKHQALWFLACTSTIRIYGDICNLGE